MLKYNLDENKQIAQKLSKILQSNFKTITDKTDETDGIKSNTDQILTDISPLAEYFIKSNNKLWELVDYVDNLIVPTDGYDEDDGDDGEDEDENEDAFDNAFEDAYADHDLYTYKLTNPDSFDNIQRNLGKIDTLITEMTVLKLPRLLKDFNKLSPNEYDILFVDHRTEEDDQESFANFASVNRVFQYVNNEFYNLVKTEGITQVSVNILINTFQSVTDDYEKMYNKLKSKAMNYNSRRNVGSGYNEQFHYLKHIRKSF